MKLLNFKRTISSRFLIQVWLETVSDSIRLETVFPMPVRRSLSETEDYLAPYIKRGLGRVQGNVTFLGIFHSEKLAGHILHTSPYYTDLWIRQLIYVNQKFPQPLFNSLRDAFQI